MKKLKTILIDLVIMLLLAILFYGLLNLYQLRVKETNGQRPTSIKLVK